MQQAGRSRRRWGRGGFTLTEMVVVVGIIVMLIGVGTPAIFSAMRRSDGGATHQVIGTIHQALSRQAKLLSSGAVIYGFSMIYNTGTAQGNIPSTAYYATQIIPWAVTPTYTSAYQQNWNTHSSVGFTSDSNFQAAIGANLLSTTTSTGSAMTGAGGGICYTTCDFADTYLPAKTIYSTSYVAGTGVSTTPSYGTTNMSATARALHVAYEPGTGFMHAVVNAVVSGSVKNACGTASTLSGFPGAFTLDPNAMRAVLPNQIEIVIYSMTNGSATRRIILYPNGSYELKGP